MNRKTLILLVAFAALVLVGVMFALQQQGSRYESSAGGLLFPDLESRLASVQKIELIAGEPSAGTRYTLLRNGSSWGVAERDGYPANNSNIQRLLVGLSNTRLLEPKTRDPEKYPRLAVGDPASDAAARLVRLIAKDGTVVAEVILGNGARNNGQYLRVPDDTQSWMGSERLAFGITHTEWLDRDLLEINQTEILRSEISPVEGRPYVVTRQDNELTLSPPPPAGQRNKPGMLHRLQSVMQNLSAEDIYLGDDLPADGWATGTHHLSSGMVIRLETLAKHQNVSGGLLKITVSTQDDASDETRSEADQLAARLHGHVYQIQAHQARMMGQTWNNLVEDIPDTSAN